VNRAPTDRSHLSIGEVLSLLQEEFPDVTISKIRFLESQGLLDPERTPSGYRKFYEGDIDRLRWILRQQKEHYLPLKVIKDRLEDAPAPATAAGASPSNGTVLGAAEGANGAPGADRPATTAVALDERPAPSAHTEAAAPVAPPPPAAPPQSRPPLAGASPVKPTSRAADPIGPTSDERPATTARPANPPAPPSAPGSVSLTAEELAQHSGLTVRDLRDLERYGLVESFTVGDAAFYDGDALVIAQTAAGFLQHGIEARHMRTYKVAVDREAGLFEQIVLPLLKQRNPEARQRARETVAELVRLGQQMRAMMLSRELRDVGGPT